MSGRPEEQLVEGSADSELHGLSLAKLSIQSDVGAFDTDDEDDDPAEAQVPPGVIMAESDSSSDSAGSADGDSSSDEDEPATVPVPAAVPVPPPAQPAPAAAADSGSETEGEEDMMPPAPPAQPAPAAADSGSETEGEEDMMPPAPPAAPPTPQARTGPADLNPRTDQGGKRTLSKMENQKGEKVTWTDDEDDEPAAVPIPPGPSAPRSMPAPLDVSDPERGTWATRGKYGPAARLKDIALLFRNPATLKDDNYMLNAKDIIDVRQAVSVLKRILSDMRSLAVVTPLIALLMVSSNKSLRLQVSSIVKRVNAIAQKYKKYEYAGRKFVYPMKDVLDRIKALRELMNTYENVNSDKSFRLRQMEQYLKALQNEVYDYVKDSFDQEEYPDWYLNDPSQKERLQQWKAKRPMRIIAAYQKAVNDYRSIARLREAINDLKRMMALYSSDGKSSKKASSDTPSSSKDTGPQGLSIFEIDSDSDDEAAAAVPMPSDGAPGPSSVGEMEEEEQVDTTAIVNEATGVQGALMYVMNGAVEIEEALMAVIRIAQSNVFNEGDWKKLAQGLLTAARQGTYSDSAIGIRHVNAIKALRQFLRKAGKQLATLNPRAAEWWENNKYDVPESVLVDLVTEADRLQVTELQGLRATDALDDVNRALESVRIIASAAGHRVGAWETLASALASLYRIYNDPSLQRPLAVGRLIGFLERAANILRMKWKESSQWFDVNITRFVNPQSSSGNRPMELGKGLDEGDIPEEIYVDDFEEEESADDDF